MIFPPRRLAATVLAAGCMFGVAACGSSSSASHAAASAPGGGTAHGVGLNLTSTERSCLKKKGVTVRIGGNDGPGGGAFPKGATGHFPKGAKGRYPKGKGHLPAGGGGPGGFGAHSAQMKTRLAAFKACGVSFGPRAGGAAGGPPSAG